MLIWLCFFGFCQGINSIYVFVYGFEAALPYSTFGLANTYIVSCFFNFKYYTMESAFKVAKCSQGRRSGFKSGGTGDQFIYTYMYA